MLGLGIGIASGYATLGLIGFQGRTDYTAIGGVVNIASRLCDKALDGQVLLTQRAYIDVESQVRTELLGTWQLKGVKDGIEVHSVLGLSESAA
jgi:adenylate cyclase